MIYNQTTIETDGTDFDNGWRANVESVFGKNPWLWAIPVFGDGPVGDGVHWPMRRVVQDAQDSGPQMPALGVAHGRQAEYDTDSDA